MSARMFRLAVVGLGIVVAVVGFLVLSGNGSAEAEESAPVLREFSPSGERVPDEDQEVVGSATLSRTPEGLRAEASLSDLMPGGVYTFWLVVYQGDKQFPDDIFVNDGFGVVVDESGSATATMRNTTGDESIDGFYVEEEGGVVAFDTLNDPMNAIVRVEVVYHGQADVAGDDLDMWLSDFWTGDPDVCAHPLGTQGTGAVPEHPYCAGYWAAEFATDTADTGDLPPSRAPAEDS